MGLFRLELQRSSCYAPGLRVTSLRRGGHTALVCCLRDEGALAFVGCCLPSLSGLFRIWYSDGTYDQLNLGDVASDGNLARQIPIDVDVSSEPGNVSWSNSRFLHWIPASWRCPGAVSSAACCSSNQRVQETEPAQQRIAPGVDGAGRGKADKGRARGCGKGKKAGGGCVVVTRKMTSLLVATLGSSCGVAAGLIDPGGLGVVLPCADCHTFSCLS